MGQWTTFDIAGEAEIDALMQEDFGPDPEPVEEETVELEEQYKDQYDDWVAAGGAHNAFAAHLMGIGAIPAELDVLSANVESAWTQLKNNLPKD